MSRINLKDRIHQGLFLLDGAMGTQLFERGLDIGKCNDYQNIEAPDKVLDVHRAYIQAGSDAVLTNTFGANKFTLGRHGLGEMVEKINLAGAQIARKAAGKEKYVLGNIGPSGDFLEPLGTLKPDDLKDAFAQQAKALLKGGVDGFIIETMTAIDEIIVAVEAVKSVTGLPVFASMSFGRAGGGFRTMMGVNIETAFAKIVPLGVDAIGFNCGSMSLDDYVELTVKFVAAGRGHGKNTMILAEPNAGLPELVDGETVYKVSPNDFALAAQRIFLAGVKIIGGCCGTSPEHIEAVARTLKI